MLIIVNVPSRTDMEDIFIRSQFEHFNELENLLQDEVNNLVKNIQRAAYSGKDHQVHYTIGKCLRESDTYHHLNPEHQKELQDNLRAIQKQFEMKGYKIEHNQLSLLE